MLTTVAAGRVFDYNYCIGMYGTYPSLKAEDLTQGDLDPNSDFRGFYSTVIEKWLGLDAVPIVGGTFEQMAFV